MKKNNKHLLSTTRVDDSMIAVFQKVVEDFYEKNRRDFSWRNAPHDPYHIFISEVMLQQTQTQRVIEKFELFIRVFPTVADLAAASLSQVLFVWQGLGYNRRGKFLHLAAQKIMNEHGGRIPNTPEELEALPGIGKATAASICAFAFNLPTIFIETNIRAVILHHFFLGKEGVSDSDVRAYVVATLDKKNPREWYYALMDYGVHLKKTLPNPSRASKHYTKQSKFEGSKRQVRGAVIRALALHGGACSIEDLFHDLRRFTEERIQPVINDLIQESMIVQEGVFLKIQ